MSRTFEFAGKVALVAYVDGAIGRAVATRLAQGGATLAVVTRRDTNAIASLAPSGRFLTLEHDMSVEEDVARCVGRVVGTYGRVDLFLSDTGGSDDAGMSPAPIPDTRLQDFDTVLAHHARPTFLGLKHVIPAIARGSGGAVVCVSSILGSKGHAGKVAQVAANHAVNAMAIVAAKEWASQAIRVNAVAPASDVARSGPGPVGLTDEAAALAAFLLSDEASYLTGAVYPVDGGEAARIAFNS